MMILIKSIISFLVIFQSSTALSIQKENPAYNLITDSSGKKIIVIGLAQNSKAGRIVETKTIHYYLDGDARWDEKLLGKTIKVTGRLHIRHIHPQKSVTPKQEVVGDMYILRKAIWEEVK